MDSGQAQQECVGGDRSPSEKNGYITVPPLPIILCIQPPLLHLRVLRMRGTATRPERLLLLLYLILAVAAQHDHGHPHHGEVKSKWDEEEYLKKNPPTPPSYWSEDTRMRMSSEEQSPARYPWLMVLHVLFMSGAFFVALPAGQWP